MTERYHPLRELFLARARQFFREPETIFWVYFFPILLMCGLGLAFRDREHDAIAVRLVGANAAVEAALATESSISVDSVAEIESPSRVDPDHDLTVVAHPDGSVEYVFDATRAESRHAREIVDRLVQEAAGREDAVTTRTTFLRAPGTRYIDWLVPGLMGLNMMGGGFWGVGFVTVDMRIRKLLKRFRATPMHRRHFLLALLGGRLIFLVPEMATILAVAHFAFGVEIQGRFVDLVAIALIGATTFAGIGLLLASRAQKIETISGLMNLTMMPMWLLGGVFFAASRFPDAAQPLIQAIPLTQLNHALRGVILHGESIFQQWAPLAILLGWSVIAYPLALRWFRWQ